MADEADLRFARIALAAGLVQQTQIDEVARFQEESRDARSLPRLMVACGVLSDPARQMIMELMMVSPLPAVAIPVATSSPGPAPTEIPIPESPPAASETALPASAPPSPADSDVNAIQGHPFGRLVLQSGYATAAHVRECLDEQHRLSTTGQAKQLGEIMVEKQYLTVAQVRELLGQQDKEILRCDKCGAKYNVTKMPAGKSVRCIKCGTALTIPAKIASPGVEASLNIHGADPLIGKVLGGCRIELKLGQGGMAAVYKGTHLGLNKVMAVKILPPASAQSREFTDRFIREARAAAKIEHPNIVQVYNVGCEQSYNFILMQFVQGRTLTEVLAELNLLPGGRALEVITEVAKGLAMAHKHGIVHRDVKPDNILVTDDGKIKISDFGLAQEVKSPKGSKADMIAGTPFYMPPEQWEGKANDARSDLYSLGITYYYLLCGKKPYMSGDPYVLMKMHAKDEPPHPKKYGCSITDGVWAIIRKMIAKKPEHRYQSAEELLKDLERERTGLEPLALLATGEKKVECGFCGTLNPKGARRCSVCHEGLGEDEAADLELGLREDEFYCPKCKEPNQRGAGECESCHAPFCRKCRVAVAQVQGYCKSCAAKMAPPDAGGAPPGGQRGAGRGR